MSMDAIRILRSIFTDMWRLWNSWNIPGTNVTPAEMGFFMLTVGMILRYVKRNLFQADDESITIGKGPYNG